MDSGITRLRTGNQAQFNIYNNGMLTCISCSVRGGGKRGGVRQSYLVFCPFSSLLHQKVI